MLVFAAAVFFILTCWISLTDFTFESFLLLASEKQNGIRNAFSLLLFLHGSALPSGVGLQNWHLWLNQAWTWMTSHRDWRWWETNGQHFSFWKRQLCWMSSVSIQFSNCLQSFRGILVVFYFVDFISHSSPATLQEIIEQRYLGLFILLSTSDSLRGKPEKHLRQSQKHVSAARRALITAFIHWDAWIIKWFWMKSELQNSRYSWTSCLSSMLNDCINNKCVNVTFYSVSHCHICRIDTLLHFSVSVVFKRGSPTFAFDQKEILSFSVSPFGLFRSVLVHDRKC